MQRKWLTLNGVIVKGRERLCGQWGISDGINSDDVLFKSHENDCRSLHCHPCRSALGVSHLAVKPWGSGVW